MAMSGRDVRLRVQGESKSCRSEPSDQLIGFRSVCRASVSDAIGVSQKRPTIHEVSQYKAERPVIFRLLAFR